MVVASLTRSSTIGLTALADKKLTWRYATKTKYLCWRDGQRKGSAVKFLWQHLSKLSERQ